MQLGLIAVIVPSGYITSVLYTFTVILLALYLCFIVFVVGCSCQYLSRYFRILLNVISDQISEQQDDLNI